MYDNVPILSTVWSINMHMITSSKLLKAYQDKLMFFTYQAGAGGEKVCIELSKHSPDLINLPYVSNPVTNRWQITHNVFNGAFSHNSHPTGWWKGIDEFIDQYDLDNNGVQVEQADLKTRSYLIRSQRFDHRMCDLFPSARMFYVVTTNRQEGKYRTSLEIAKQMLDPLDTMDQIQGGLRGYYGKQTEDEILTKHADFFDAIIAAGGSYMFLLEFLNPALTKPVLHPTMHVTEMDIGYLCSKQLVYDYFNNTYLPYRRSIDLGLSYKQDLGDTLANLNLTKNQIVLPFSTILDGQQMAEKFEIELDVPAYTSAMAAWHANNLRVIKDLETDYGIRL